MFKEHEQIVLTADVLGDEGEELKPGDAGTVIHVHPLTQPLLWSSCPWMATPWPSRPCCRHRRVR